MNITVYLSGMIDRLGITVFKGDIMNMMNK